MQPERRETHDCQLGVDVYPRAWRRRRASCAARVRRVDRHAAHAGRRDHRVVKRGAAEVVDVHLEVARRPLRLAPWQLATSLRLGSCLHPSLDVGRGWLSRVELRLQALHIRGTQRRYPLKAVRRVRPTKAEAIVDREARLASAAPPAEALGPQVSVLDGAESVG